MCNVMAFVCVTFSQSCQMRKSPLSKTDLGGCRLLHADDGTLQFVFVPEPFLSFPPLLLCVFLFCFSSSPPAAAPLFRANEDIQSSHVLLVSHAGSLISSLLSSLFLLPPPPFSLDSALIELNYTRHDSPLYLRPLLARDKATQLPPLLIFVVVGRKPVKKKKRRGDL